MVENVTNPISLYVRYLIQNLHYYNIQYKKLRLSLTHLSDEMNCYKRKNVLILEVYSKKNYNVMYKKNLCHILEPNRNKLKTICFT
jgi:hypothetical protein